MLEVSTLYLLLAMFGFVLLGILVIHHHNCTDQICRKRHEIRRLTIDLTAKNAVLEEQIAELKAAIDDVNDQIALLELRQQP